MARPGVMLYFSVLPALDSLPPASAGTLLLAAMHYAQDGQEPVFEDSTLAFAWAILKPSIDRDAEVYDEKRLRGEWMTYCRQCKREGNDAVAFETWRQRTDTDPLRTDTDPQPISVSISNPLSISDSMSVSISNNSIAADKSPRRSRFVPPTVEQVEEYVRSRGSSVDPQGFIDFYEAKGWMVGRTTMRNWRAACRNAESWERWKKTSQPKDRARTDADYEGGDSFV